MDWMQGRYNWYWMLDGAYMDLGYRRSRADPCVHLRTIGTKKTITNTFNDDTFGLSMTKKGAEMAKMELSKVYEIKDLGTPSFILGMTIHQDPDTGTISLSQKAYLVCVLEQFSIMECNPHYTPLSPGIILTVDMSPKGNEEHIFMADKPYCQVLGALMWAQAAMCPDLSFTVALLA